MKDEKDLNRTKIDQRGEKPRTGTKKKNPTGGMEVCVVCCKDGNMERKVT
jgi:hypothetical protein